MSGGGSTSKPRKLTQQEFAFIESQTNLANFQLQELQRTSTLQQDFLTQLQPLVEQQTAQAEQAAAEEQRLAPIREELLNMQIEDLRNQGQATPEQIRQIENATNAALESGNIDISRYEQQGLEALRTELAPSLGLRPTDTPILDRGARIAAEAVRQRGQLESNLRGAQAQARLNLPLAQSQITQAAAGSALSLQEATRQFQDQLRQQAFANRLNLQSTASNIGLGLGSVSPANIIQNQQITKSSPGTLDTISGVLGGLGGLGLGLGAIAKAGGIGAIFSSKKMKTDKAAIEEDQALKVVEDLPVESWRYREGLGLGSERRHIGPYAEDFRDLTGTGDGVTLNLIDTTGVTFAAMKGLAKKVKQIERGLGLKEDHGRHGALGLRAAA